MTFLELCKATRQECGIQGQNIPPTVTGQSGLVKRIVEWVRDADLFIQTMHPDWAFLWAEFRKDTIINSAALTKPDDFGVWDRTAFAIDQGTVNGRPLTYTSYKEWRKNHNLKTNSEPTTITILPNNNLMLAHPANAIYEIYGEYWKAPVLLSADDQLPLYPIRFHRAIITKAKMWFFEDFESIDQWKQAKDEFDFWINELESFALPEQQEANQSNTTFVVRPA